MTERFIEDTDIEYYELSPINKVSDKSNIG